MTDEDAPTLERDPRTVVERRMPLENLQAFEAGYREGRAAEREDTVRWLEGPAARRWRVAPSIARVLKHTEVK